MHTLPNRFRPALLAGLALASLASAGCHRHRYERCDDDRVIVYRDEPRYYYRRYDDYPRYDVPYRDRRWDRDDHRWGGDDRHDPRPDPRSDIRDDRVPRVARPDAPARPNPVPNNPYRRWGRTG